MTAAELRGAAETLRARAQDVTRHSGGRDLWFDADIDLRNAIRGTFIGNEKSAPDDARWIALMSPGVGLALADWLEYTFDQGHSGDMDDNGCDECAPALALARLINGEQP